MNVPFNKVASAALHKARTLIFRRAVTILSSRVAVEGFSKDHYIIIEPNGKLICDCEGFKEYELCSHVVAVAMILEHDESVESA